MVLVRLLGYLLLLAALGLAGYDAFRHFQHTATDLYSLGAFIDQIAGPDITAKWPQTIRPVLAWPSWAVTGVLGVVLVFFSRSRD